MFSIYIFNRFVMFSIYIFNVFYTQCHDIKIKFDVGVVLIEKKHTVNRYERSSSQHIFAINM